MPNFSQSLKAEIQRVSRKEIKLSVTPVHGSSIALKKSVADLKRRVAALETENKRILSLQIKTHEQQPEAAPEAAGKIRITSRTIRVLRKKLGLSQEGFGKLIGVTRQNVFVMESKEGRLRTRGQTLPNILAIRNIGRREAKQRLKEIEMLGKKAKRK